MIEKNTKAGNFYVGFGTPLTYITGGTGITRIVPRNTKL